MNGEVEPIKIKRRFPLRRFDDIGAEPTAAYLVKGLIPREGLVVVWGPPKCGKSFWTFDLVMHVALGWPYRARRVSRGTVVYIALEGERALGARVEAYRCERLAEETEAVPFYLLTTRLDLASDHPHLIADIRAQLGETGCACIVIDTLNRSLAGSESSDEDMGSYIKAADALREAFRCAVVIVHHCGIDDRRPRGHTSLAGACDAQIAVRRETGGTTIATVELMKDGETGAEIHSTLKVVELGSDKDGEPITSCVVEAIDGGTTSARRARKPATGQSKVALDLLHRAITDAGQTPPASNHIPAGQNVVVPVDLWRRYCYEGLIEGRDNPDSQRKAFNRAAAKLQGIGAIGQWDGLVWPVQ